jgi:hypothetical protein
MKSMSQFKPIIRNPGDTIRSEDWNNLQKGLLAEISKLDEKIRWLKEYIENMSERIVLTNLESTLGKSYKLTEIVPGEKKSYGVSIMGLITRQWVTSILGPGDICYFGIAEYCDLIYYWSGAENGNRPSLEIIIEYVDGNVVKAGTNIFVNDKAKLSPSNKDNPYFQFLFSENGIWYKYGIRNPHPEKEIRYIKFRNGNAQCNPRIGNVIQLKTKVRPIAW